MVAKIETRNPEHEIRDKVYNMSSKLDKIRRKIERGERVKSIRESLGLTQESFGMCLAQRMRDVGVVANYSRSKISLLEGGERKLTAEEAVVIADLDPFARGGTWLIFGEARKRVLIPDPRKKQPTSRAAGE